jgi:Tfp pilus assembly protein PilO
MLVIIFLVMAILLVIGYLLMFTNFISKEETVVAKKPAKKAAVKKPAKAVAKKAVKKTVAKPVSKKK